MIIGRLKNNNETVGPMAALVDDENQLISVGTGKDRVAVNLSKETNVRVFVSKIFTIIIDDLGSITIAFSRIDFNRSRRFRNSNPSNS